MGDPEEQECTLAAALERCLASEEIQGFSVRTEWLDQPVDKVHKIRFTKMNLISYADVRSGSRVFTSFVKTPESYHSPKGLTYRLWDNKGAAPRSSYLDHILSDRGYTTVADPKLPAQLMFFFPTWYAPDSKARLTHFEQATISEIDDKRQIWDNLVAAGTEEYMAKSYNDLSQFYEQERAWEAAHGKRQLYIKSRNGVAQNGVWCCNGVDETTAQL